MNTAAHRVLCEGPSRAPTALRRTFHRHMAAAHEAMTQGEFARAAHEAMTQGEFARAACESKEAIHLAEMFPQQATEGSPEPLTEARELNSQALARWRP